MLRSFAAEGVLFVISNLTLIFRSLIVESYPTAWWKQQGGKKGLRDQLTPHLLLRGFGKRPGVTESVLLRRSEEGTNCYTKTVAGNFHVRRK